MPSGTPNRAVPPRPGSIAESGKNPMPSGTVAPRQTRRSGTVPIITTAAIPAAPQATERAKPRCRPGFVEAASGSQAEPHAKRYSAGHARPLPAIPREAREDRTPRCIRVHPSASLFICVTACFACFATRRHKARQGSPAELHAERYAARHRQVPSWRRDAAASAGIGNFRQNPMPSGTPPRDPGSAHRGDAAKKFGTTDEHG